MPTTTDAAATPFTPMPSLPDATAEAAARAEAAGRPTVVLEDDDTEHAARHGDIRYAVQDLAGFHAAPAAGYTARLVIAPARPPAAPYGFGAIVDAGTRRLAADLLFLYDEDARDLPRAARAVLFARSGVGLNEMYAGLLGEVAMHLHAEVARLAGGDRADAVVAQAAEHHEAKELRAALGLG